MVVADDGVPARPVGGSRGVELVVGVAAIAPYEVQNWEGRGAAWMDVVVADAQAVLVPAMSVSTGDAACA